MACVLERAPAKCFLQEVLGPIEMQTMGREYVPWTAASPSRSQCSLVGSPVQAESSAGLRIFLAHYSVGELVPIPPL